MSFAQRAALPILVVITALLGCASSDSAKFGSQIRQWVPIGTPVADARQIMEYRAFECHLIAASNIFNFSGVDCLDCERSRFHDWSARFIIQDGKVTDYGPMGAD